MRLVFATSGDRPAGVKQGVEDFEKQKNISDLCFLKNFIEV